MTLPAFTFEKLSPPRARKPAAAVEPEPRGKLRRMLDRLLMRGDAAAGTHRQEPHRRDVSRRLPRQH